MNSKKHRQRKGGTPKTQTDKAADSASNPILESTSNASSPTNSACPYLAVTGALLAIALSQLVFIGWHATAHTRDAVPCIAAALLTWGLVTLCGRMPARFASVTVGAATAIAIFLATRISPADALLLPSEPRPWNGLWYLLTPIAIGLITWFSDRQTIWRLNQSILADQSSDSDAGQRLTWNHIRQHRFVVSTLVLWIGVVAVTYLFGSTTERTGFRMITVPHDLASGKLPLMGYSFLVDDQFVMNETVSAVEQVSWFAGTFRYDNSFRYLRAGYSFLGAQWSGFLSQKTSLLVVNFLSWLACLYFVFRMTVRWFGSIRAACVAAALAAIGIGMGVHINDTTPHLLSFALYFFGVTLLDESGIGRERQDWRCHLQIAVVIGSISLAYNVAQMLLLVYLVLGIRRQSIAHWLPAMIIALSFRPVWQQILPALSINVVDVESEYLWRAIEAWQSTLASGIVPFLWQVIALTAEIVTSIESPWILVLGVIGLATIRQTDRMLLCLVSLAAPLGACLVFAPAATARGYIIYGASIVLYVAIGGLFERFATAGDAGGNERLPRSSKWAIGLLLGCLVLQLVWTTSHYRNWTAPCKAFFLGWDDAAALMTAKPTVLNLTGNEPVPRAFGGEATARDSGMIETPPKVSIQVRSVLQSACTRLPFIVSILLALNLSFGSRFGRRVASGLWLSWSILCILFAFTAIDSESAFVDPRNAIALQPGKSLTYDVDASLSARQTLQRFVAETGSDGVEVLVATTGNCDVSWTSGDREIPLTQRTEDTWRTTELTDIAAIVDADRWQFVLTNPSDELIQLQGWQRSDLEGRKIGAGRFRVFPAIELRVRDPATGALKAAFF
ncbi:MAG: hypothetical protein HKN47_15290 [Pirellulaceae bacterium]|nr:hypothetical protein [Pirellulaceae bacterium]